VPQSLIQRVALAPSAGVQGRVCEDATHAYLQLKLKVRKFVYSVIPS